MHEAQAKDTAEAAKKKTTGVKRLYKFYAVVKHRQLDITTNQPKPAETLEFESKAAMREALETPAYENTEVRVIRGYELNVNAKRSFSVN